MNILLSLQEERRGWRERAQLLIFISQKATVFTLNNNWSILADGFEPLRGGVLFFALPS